jgi:hypothetical protein
MIRGGEVVAFDTLGISSSLTGLLNDTFELPHQYNWLCYAHQLMEGLGAWMASGFLDSASTLSVDDHCFFHVGRCFDEIVSLTKPSRYPPNSTPSWKAD